MLTKWKIKRNHICIKWRAITFCLTCIITCVVCFGLIITIIAGVAYGYNYSFAEFITHTKSDVTVYMRRGQFYDHPDIAPAPNRRMGDEDDLFSSNVTSEYEEQDLSNNDSTPLSEKWLKDEDAREYAIKLTKYKSKERTHLDDPELNESQKIKPIYMPTLPSTRRMSNIPIVIPTTIWRSGSSQIVLRKFLPLNDIKEEIHTKESDSYQDDNSMYKTRPNKIGYNDREMEKNEPDIKIRFDDIPERQLRPISTSATNSRNDQDDFIEEESENNVYKPVK